MSLRHFSQNQGRVFRSESHAIADRMLDLSFAIDVGHVIQIALGVGDVEVNGWGNLAVVHGDEGCSQAGRAAGALGVSDLRLESGHRNSTRVLAESELQSTGFYAVIHFGGGAVQIHVVNVGGCDTCFFESQSNGASGLFGRIAHSDPVEGLASRSVSTNFGVDASAARTGVYVIFQDEHPRAFGDYKAVAVGGKRARGAVG